MLPLKYEMLYILKYMVIF